MGGKNWQEVSQPLQTPDLHNIHGPLHRSRLLFLYFDKRLIALCKFLISFSQTKIILAFPLLYWLPNGFT
jgi:hypothetical protein